MATVFCVRNATGRIRTARIGRGIQGFIAGRGDHNESTFRRHRIFRSFNHRIHHAQTHKTYRLVVVVGAVAYLDRDSGNYHFCFWVAASGCDSERGIVMKQIQTEMLIEALSGVALFAMFTAMLWMGMTF